MPQVRILPGAPARRRSPGIHHHEPPGYRCPFCRLLAGEDSDLNNQQDVVLRTGSTAALVSPTWWVANPGHVLVIPVEHVENVYDVPDELLGDVYRTARRIAVALRAAHDCAGTSMRQHNEPAGGQDVWHLHVHVFPRYDGDRLYQSHDERIAASPEMRARYAEKVRASLRA